jgi:hypothetical protein
MLNEEAGLDERVRGRIATELTRRLGAWATEAHEMGRHLDFDEDTTRLLQQATAARSHGPPSP